MTNSKDILEELVLNESVAIFRRYRIDQDQAADRLRSEFDRNPKVLEIIAKASGAADVRRTRHYRDLVTQIRKDIYYDLRRYVKSEDELKQAVTELEKADTNTAKHDIDNLVRRIVSFHESTRERMVQLDAFNASILEFLGEARTIVDVGCGVYPLVFPIRKGQSFLALDQDVMAIHAVSAWAQLRDNYHIEAIHWSLDEGWDSVSPPGGDSTFDAALMLKLVPVVQRQNRELLGLLARIPAKRWIVTGSRVALAKKQNIERRERKALMKFARMANRRVVGEFSIETEFGLVLDETVTK